MEFVRDSAKQIQLLSELLFSVPSSVEETAGKRPRLVPELAASLGEVDLGSLERLAASNHVIVRGFAALRNAFENVGNDAGTGWINESLQREQSRIDHALRYLSQICETLNERGCLVTVIKSLDHVPDLGSDLDLYSDADSAAIIAAMKQAFGAKLADRSWGDRLANKWNFVVPGLPELVEVHVGRLGQTGEQTAAITRSVAECARVLEAGSYRFRVAAPEERIVISTLQRMYRHFYIRLCDIVDNAKLLDDRAVDFDYLESLGRQSGLWEGIATYLVIISQYVEQYRGYGVPLSGRIVRSAKFGTSQVRFRKDFLRVSILPHSIDLYARELKSFLLRGDLRNGLRLSLLPCLATAAALEQKITGSDKGIW